MKIVDISEITVSSGNGGNGAVAFRREKHVANGGPAGGDGGKGGSVIFQATEELQTLLDFRYRHHFKAPSGEHGGIKKMHGKKGEDLIIPVPVGTVIRDVETDKVICDMSTPGQTFMAAKGGRGGRGNPHFTTAVYQAPRYAEPGKPGRTRQLSLELKSIADVGLVGLPNAGKSSLLTAISAARPKVADYPFTTLKPNLGVVKRSEGDGFVVADIPGLIEGASEGIGLGHDFLRHIERTRLLLHMVDMSAPDPVKDYLTIQEELKAHPAKLSEKPQLLVLNKRDVVDDNELEIVLDFFSEVTDQTPFIISAVARLGLKPLLFEIEKQLEAMPPLPLHEIEPEVEFEADTDVNDFEIEEEDGMFLVHCAPLERMLELSDLEDARALHRLQKEIRRLGILDALHEAGAGTGDTIRIGYLEFDHL